MQKKNSDHMIVAIHVTNRVRQAGRVQAVLTRYGKHIKTRIGLHDADGRTASPNGLILLEFVAARKRLDAAQTDLNAIPGVEARSITFGH